MILVPDQHVRGQPGSLGLVDVSGTNSFGLGSAHLNILSRRG